MDILKVIALLMDYPNAEKQAAKTEMAEVINNAVEISPQHRSNLIVCLEDIYGGELMDAEERYTSLFEQGRMMSLHLFEHVHGESRDRGQAMVDLMAEYDQFGFEINAKELPDYLPMFLEYLSHKPDLDAREWLSDVSHILAVLAARLIERESPYAHLFEALLLIVGKSEEVAPLMATVKAEEPDNTPEALDKEWEEIAVTFGTEDQNCQPSPRNLDQINPNDPVPIRMVDAATPVAMKGAR